MVKCNVKSISNMNSRLSGFMSSWTARSGPSWTPGSRVYAFAPPQTKCVSCEGYYYDGEKWDAKLQQMSGRFVCRHCLPRNPEMTALCQAIPYDVLRVVMDNTPEAVTVRETLM